MGRWINHFMGNESTFGRIMGRIAIMIGANLMFILLSFPLITFGPALAALFYVMLETLHRDDSLNPFKTFWKGFVMNLKQGIFSTVCFAAAAFILILDIRFCRMSGGILELFKYPCCAFLIILLIEAVYLFPVMAAFQDTFPHLLRNAFFFAFRKPWKIPLAAGLFVVPVVVTVLDVRNRPLYGFLWVVIGFGLITMMISELIYKDIADFLPKDESDILDLQDKSLKKQNSAPEKSQKEILREMKKLE